MDFRIVELPPVRVACLRRTGPYGPELGAFWRGPVAAWMEANGLMERDRYGIGLDNPAVVRPESCRYDAGVEVSAGFMVAPPAFVVDLPGGLYAVGYFDGPIAGIGAAWSELSRAVAGDNARMPDFSRPCFEHYPAESGFDPATGRLGFEICIPVLPR